MIRAVKILLSLFRGDLIKPVFVIASPDNGLERSPFSFVFGGLCRAEVELLRDEGGLFNYEFFG